LIIILYLLIEAEVLSGSISAIPSPASQGNILFLPGVFPGSHIGLTG